MMLPNYFPTCPGQSFSLASMQVVQDKLRNINELSNSK